MSNKTILENNHAQKTVRDQEDIVVLPSLSLQTFRGSKVVKEFNAIGAEADTYLVEKGNQQYFLKLYRKGIKVNTDILESISVLSHEYPYFATLEEYGFHEELGRYYELSEYISEGSLADVDKNSIDIEPFIQSMNEALNLLHQKMIIHRDLKPGNILLRSIDPQEIAVVDFGISSVIQEYMSKVQTTFKGVYAYAAPEVMSDYFGKEVDYWSLGIVLLELLDKNPLSGLDSNVISHTLVTKNIEIPQKLENRFKLLLRGLLTRDTKKRWDYEAVKSWLHGGSPDVYYDTVETGEDTAYKHKFKGHYYSKKELAKVFVQGDNFNDALKHMGRGYITKFLEKLEEYDEAIKLDEEFSSPLEKLIYFIYSQEKKLPFSLYGVMVDIDYLFVLLLKYIEEHMAETEKKIFELLMSKKLLTLVEIYESVTSNKIEYKDLIKTLPEDRSEIAEYLNLTSAVQNNRVEHVKLLVSHLNSIDEEALMLALEQQNKEIINLLSSKAKTISDKHFNKAVNLAIRLQDFNIINTVLKTNKGILENSALSIAMESEDRNIVKSILSRVQNISVDNIKNLINNYTYLIDKALIGKSDISSVEIIAFLLRHNDIDLLQKLFSGQKIGKRFLQYLESLNNREKLDNIPIDNFLIFNQKYEILDNESLATAAIKSHHIDLIQHLSNIFDNLPQEKDELLNVIIENDNLELYKKYEKNFLNSSEDILYQSIKKHSKKMAKYLIPRTTPLHNKLLFLAIASDQIEIVKLLDEHGVPIEAKGKYGDSALQYAINKGRESIAKYFIKHGVTINEIDKNGNSLLHDTINRNYIDISKMLLENGINVNVQNKNGDTPLHIATRKNHLDIAEALINNYDTDINSKNNKGVTPFAYSKNKKTIELFIKKNSKININEVDENGNSAVFQCMKLCNEDFIYELIDRGASLFIINYQNDSPIYKATKNIVEYFIKILNRAIQNNNEKLIQKILYTNIKNIQLQGFIQKSSYLKTEDFIHQAIISNRNSLLEIILQKGINLQIPKTPPSSYFDPVYSSLHQAIVSNNVEAIPILLRYGANCDGRIYRDLLQTEYEIAHPNAIELAIEYENIEAIKIFEKYCDLSEICETLKQHKIKDNIRKYFANKCPMLSNTYYFQRPLNPSFKTSVTQHKYEKDKQSKERFKKIKINWREDDIFVIIFKMILFIILTIWVLIVEF